MLRITKQTDYGIIALTRLAAAPGRVWSAAELSADSGLPLPMMSKVLKALARADFVHSLRGTAGGYRLHREPKGLSIGEIIAALEGPIALTECLTAAGEPCRHLELCPTNGHWHQINGAIHGALAQVSLADLVQPAAAAIAVDDIPTLARRPQAAAAAAQP